MIESADRLAGESQVTLLLSSPEITVQPSLNEIKRVLGRLMRSLVESAKPFVRWMDGTCIPCPPQPTGPDDEDPFLHSFYGDVSQHPQVVKAMLALSSIAQAAVTGITRLVTLLATCGSRALLRLLLVVSLSTNSGHPSAHNMQFAQKACWLQAFSSPLLGSFWIEHSLKLTHGSFVMAGCTPIPHLHVAAGSEKTSQMRPLCWLCCAQIHTFKAAVAIPVMCSWQVAILFLIPCATSMLKGTRYASLGL